MAGNKTNSNSITSILVEKLNNRKSGFRYKMLEEWQLPSDIFFVDGTNKQTPIREMRNKEVDIIGRSGTKIKVLIEIKAGNRERLQDSQKENGEYDETAKANPDIKFIYIIPDKYEYIDQIPLTMKICKWSEIYNIALKYDNTGLITQIEAFVGNSFSALDKILSKGDVIMYFNPDVIGNVLSLYKKKKNLMEAFIKSQPTLISDGSDGEYDFGNHYKIYKDEKHNHDNVWIGLLSLEDLIKTEHPSQADDKTLPKIAEKNSFFIWFGLYNNKAPYFINEDNIEDSPNYYKAQWEKGNGNDYFFPIKENNGSPPKFLYEKDLEIQQKEFNKLLEDNINRVLYHLDFRD